MVLVAPIDGASAHFGLFVLNISIIYQYYINSSLAYVMPYCGSPSFGERPFLLGLTVPSDWTAANSRDCMAAALMERAAALGFDFLLAPQSLAELYAPSDLGACARSDNPCEAPGLSAFDNDGSQRDLVWLQRPLMTAAHGVTVSISEEILDHEHMVQLKELVAAARVPGEEERCVLLEVTIETSGRRQNAQLDDLVADEDDMLESFVISLGKTVPKTDFKTPRGTVNAMPEPEWLRRVLLHLHEIECDGVSFVLSDPLGEIASVGKSLARSVFVV